MSSKLYFFLILLSFSYLKTIANDSLLIPEYVSSAKLITEADSLMSIDSMNAALEKVEQINPGDTNYYTALLKKTYILSQLERYDEALVFCEEGISAKEISDHQAFRLNKGYTLNLKGEKKEAKKVYQELLKDYPFYKEASNNLAFQHLELKEYDSSYAAYKKHAKLYPFDINAHFNLGVFAFNEGNLTETFLAFNMIVLLEPYSDKAYRVLGLLNELSNNTKVEIEEKEGFELESTEFDEIDLLIEMIK